MSKHENYQTGALVFLGLIVLYLTFCNGKKSFFEAIPGMSTYAPVDDTGVTRDKVIIDNDTKKVLQNRCGLDNLDSAALLPSTQQTEKNYADGLMTRVTNPVKLVDASLIKLPRPSNSQTRRNVNMSFRSEPPNPRVRDYPWLNSTIEPYPTNKLGGLE